MEHNHVYSNLLLSNCKENYARLGQPLILHNFMNNYWEANLKYTPITFAVHTRTVTKPKSPGTKEVLPRISRSLFSPCIQSFALERHGTEIRICYVISLCPESSENIPILLQEADLCFSKQNCPRNPKIGSKQSVVVATH